MRTRDQINLGLAQPLCNELTSSKFNRLTCRNVLLFSFRIFFPACLGEDHDALLPGMLWLLQDCQLSFRLIKMCNTSVAQDGELISSMYLLYNKVHLLATQRC